MLSRIDLKVFVVVALCGSMMACSHSGDHRNPNDRESMTEAGRRLDKRTDNMNKKVAGVAEASDYIEVKFNQGSATLTAETKAQLDGLIAAASKRGELDEIKVLAWSDREYPANEKVKLPSSQRTLADKRAEAVEDYIDNLKLEDSVDVDKYNMAHRPGFVARVFNTGDARFKRTLVAAGLPATADDPKVSSKASRAIVMALID